VRVAPSAALEVAGTLQVAELATAGTNSVGPGAVISVSDDLTLDSRLNMTGATLSTSRHTTIITVKSGGLLTLGHPLTAAQVNLAGSVQTAGADVAVLNLTAGTMHSSAPITAGRVNLAGGTLHLAGDGSLSAGRLIVSGGMLDAATGAVVAVSDRLIVDADLDLTGVTLSTVPQVTDVTVAEGRTLVVGGALVGGELQVAGTVQAAGADVTGLDVAYHGAFYSSADVAAQTLSVRGGLLATSGSLTAGNAELTQSGLLQVGQTLHAGELSVAGTVQTAGASSGDT
jgi:hypothetical protein